MAWALSDEELEGLLAQMSVEEKVCLLNGRNLWKTVLNYRLNIPEIVMTDGAHGVRYSVDQIESVNDERDALDQFLTVIARRGDDAPDMVGTSEPATCYPNGASLGCSWDIDLAYEFGTSLAIECQVFGVNLLLGPGVNIRRTPLAGRAYEYYSEDPVLSGDMAAAVIRGLQDNGVGASLKHFACNNSEIERTTMSSDVDERALREIYLKGFERAIAKSDPWTVMSAYNRLNGVHAAENGWLLTTVLREEWGYQGVVVSDWHAINNQAAALNAGNDLDMPESKTRRQDLLAALKAGSVDTETLDRSCRRLLQLVRRAKAAERPKSGFDQEAHHDMAQRAALASIVLLRNQEDVLPLSRSARQHILVIGQGALTPMVQGSGSATVRPTRLDIPLDEIRKLAGEEVQIDHLPCATADDGEAALTAARRADCVIVFANSDSTIDGERADRLTLDLEAGQDALIAAIAAINPRTIVVLATPDAVVMPWVDDVAAIVETFYSGQAMGGALAQILFGVANPSGKLTTTFPKRMEDIPGFLTYPGENGRHLYCEGVHVGYRHYDRKKVEPLFPFGFGLSYTRFAYADLHLSAECVGDEDEVIVSFDLTNLGDCSGAEVSQLYARPLTSRLHRPVRELKGFAKTQLQSGETKRVSIPLSSRDLRYYDPARGGWVMDPGVVMIEVGASSRDIRLSAPLESRTKIMPSPPLDIDTQPAVVFDRPGARAALAAWLSRRLDIELAAAEQLMERSKSSFLGIHKTLCWYIGDCLPASDLQGFLDGLSTGRAFETCDSELGR
jgi:beta-glucosidase